MHEEVLSMVIENAREKKARERACNRERECRRLNF